MADAANIEAKNGTLYARGLEPDDMVTGYSRWSMEGKYDSEMRDGVYNGPLYAAKAVNRYIPNKQARILDVAAGTGKVGEELQKLGFKNLDALDPSAGMLTEARTKKLYRGHLLTMFLESGVPILDDEYDGLVISGGMGEGHIPPEAMYEMARIVKPGGIVCIVMREEYISMVEKYNNGKLENVMMRMEEEKLWKNVARAVIQNFAFNKTGVSFTFRVL